jgi:protein-S-isoprenylcysteine O-methyltransferase Ste14
MQFFSILLLILCWIGYFFIHSLTASNVFKDWAIRTFEGFRPFYRLSYIVLSVLLLLPPLAVLYLNKWPQIWQWPSTVSWLQDGIAIAVLIAFAISLRAYSGMDFMGIYQASGTIQKSPEQFRISNFHRYVRHPWYFLALLLLWSRDMNLGFFITAILATGYFIVGSRLEEKKLVLQFGDAYHQYCQRVSGLVPIPGKILTREEAKQLSNISEEINR